jgi:hypothetical protein
VSYLDTVGLRGHFTEATWFGVLSAGSFLGGAGIIWITTRTTELRDPRRVGQALLALTTAMMLATLTFALAGAFWLALPAFWVGRWVRIAAAPLMVRALHQRKEDA